MPDVQLSAADQAVLRYLMAAKLDPGRILLRPDVLRHVARLVPCDAIGMSLSDPDGCLDEVELPPGHLADLGNSGCHPPMRLGLTHWSRLPRHAEGLRAVGLADAVSVGFRHGRDRVARLWLDRWSGRFTERDLTLLTMITPTVQRLVGEPGSLILPDELTDQERRTLALVAAGLSNPDIAARMGVATCTVRKHLEHAYRKLGVTNRLAAVTALQGLLSPPGESRSTRPGATG